MIGQKIGLEHLLPLAAEVLEHNPLAEGDFYPGDLLANVVKCDEWLRSYEDLFKRIATVAERALKEAAGVEYKDLRKMLSGFKKTL